MGSLTTFFAPPQADSSIRVVAHRPRQTDQPIETLTVQQFVERSAANRVVWREGENGVLMVTIDTASVSLMETRFQLR